LPTLPFLLLALWYYHKASGRFYHWLMSQHTLGGYVREYQAGKGLSAGTKRKALIISWLAAGISLVLASHPLTLGLIVAGTVWGTIYILRMKTIRGEANLPPQPTGKHNGGEPERHG
jgi:uncharacterized protein